MKVKKKIRYAGECCICHEPIEVGEEYVEAPYENKQCHIDCMETEPLILEVVERTLQRRDRGVSRRQTVNGSTITVPAKQLVNKKLPLFIRVSCVDYTGTLLQKLPNARNALVGIHPSPVILFHLCLPVREINRQGRQLPFPQRDIIVLRLLQRKKVSLRTDDYIFTFHGCTTVIMCCTGNSLGNQVAKLCLFSQY